MKIDQYILTKIAEEASEVAQRALKAAQFGPDQIEPGQELTNAERLIEEVYDLGIWVQIAADNHITEQGTRGGYRSRFRVKLFTIMGMVELATREGRLEDGILQIKLPG